MKLQTWIVGRNRHSGEWSEGGAVEEYPPEHWEVFQVEATGRYSAVSKAQKERRRVRAREKRQAEKDQSQ